MTMSRSRTDPERYLEDFDEQQSSREFLSIKNLDKFFTNIYVYWRSQGYWAIIASRISNLVTIAFTVLFSLFLVGFVNWKQVIKCGGHEEECKNVELIENNISNGDAFGVIVIMYTLVFAIYFLWHLLNFILSLNSLKRTRYFYHSKLKIGDERLKHCDWSIVMEKIVSLQESTRLYHNRYLDALDITNRILRKENYMIAFVNKGILDFRMPSFQNLFFFKSDNRKFSNADILRTDMSDFANSEKKHKIKGIKSKTNLLKYPLWNASEMNSNQHLLESAGPSPANSSTKEQFLGLKTMISTKIKKKLKAQKNRFKDKRRGYQHVGIDDDKMLNEEQDSDVSDASDNDNDGLGHPVSTNIQNQESDALFFENYVHRKLSEHEEAMNEYNEGSKGFLGSILNWNLSYIIFESMFNEEMRLRSSFISNSSKLKWKFFWFGLGNLCLTPFTSVFCIFFYFFENAEEMHSNKGDLMSFRQWTRLSLLKFREFNELPHAFEKRMFCAAQPSTEYIDSFAKEPHILILCELISYIAGSIVSVLVLLTFIDSSILLNIELLGRSLVTYLAIFSALLAISRSNIRYDDFNKDNESQMNVIAQHTHYFPRHWQGRCHKTNVLSEFKSLFQPKIKLFLNEMINVFVTPFILINMANSVQSLIDFVVNESEHVDGVGDISSFSRFNFHHVENDLGKDVEEEHKESDIGLPASMENRQISNVSSASSSSTFSEPCSKIKSTETSLNNKKLESSLLTFAMNYPQWRSNQYQSAALQSITHFNKAAPASMSTMHLGLNFSQLLTSPKHSQQIKPSTSEQGMLSEINEIDSPTSQHKNEEKKEEDNEEQNKTGPYKTLAMDATTKLNK